ncbi:MAG: hypothetical protein WD294_04855 [Phycisphaeraceae bacterium]
MSYKRGPYNFAFYERHNEPYRYGAAIHFAHGKAHDVPQLTPLSEAQKWDTRFDAEALHWATDLPRMEPHMMQWGPVTGQFAWKLYRAIDWTHMHHEQTYDILSERSIPWEEKKRWTDESVEYYLNLDDLARSPAPLEVTMRRAGVMMKPYFTYFRNKYPRTNNFFYVAHWWHPVMYEAMMIAGNDDEQDQSVQDTHHLLYEEVFDNRPQRMLLSRETMPRYSRMSPESANIFDNLHMLHGIAYDILSYEGWTPEQKRKELYRVIEAMSYQPGDEQYVRRFPIPYPDMDPRIYSDWMIPAEGEMNRIMLEMMEEMMPAMMPGGMDEQMHEQVMEQVRMKLRPGVEEDEIEGSLHDAIKQLMPDMQMDPESMEPGVPPQKMIDAMMAGWQEKADAIPEVEPWPMNQDPTLPPLDNRHNGSTE